LGQWLKKGSFAFAEAIAVKLQFHLSWNRRTYILVGNNEVVKKHYLAQMEAVRKTTSLKIFP
jgi:hypothetical protein